jgi:hypothetical protein
MLEFLVASGWMRFKGAGIGFAVAAPVGPIGMLCIRTTLERGRVAGFCGGVGAAVADTIVGGVGASGMNLSGGWLRQLQRPGDGEFVHLRRGPARQRITKGCANAPGKLLGLGGLRLGGQKALEHAWRQGGRRRLLRDCRDPEERRRQKGQKQSHVQASRRTLPSEEQGGQRNHRLTPVR